MRAERLLEALVSYRSPFRPARPMGESDGGRSRRRVPAPRTSKAERFKDGVKKSGSIRTTRKLLPRGDREEHIQSDNARERERAKRTGSTNIDQQGNRANVRQNTTRQGQ